MKNYIIMLLMLLSYNVKSQSVFPMKGGKVVYEKIDTLENSSKDKIYSYAKKWLADNFKDSKQIIHSEDVATGQIIGKGQLVVADRNSTGIFIDSEKMNISIQIDCRDNRYRIRIYDIEVVTRVPMGYSDILTPLNYFEQGQNMKKNRAKRWANLAPQINDRINNLILYFSQEIKKSNTDDF